MESTKLAPRSETPHTATVLTPPLINSLPWRPVPNCPRVWVKELRNEHGVVHALISINAGASTPGHPHAAAHQYIWVLAGSATIAGQWASEGSSVYVPPGTEHSVTNVGSAGCTLLQTHVPV